MTSCFFTPDTKLLHQQVLTDGTQPIIPWALIYCECISLTFVRNSKGNIVLWNCAFLFHWQGCFSVLKWENPRIELWEWLPQPQHVGVWWLKVNSTNTITKKSESDMAQLYMYCRCSVIRHVRKLERSVLQEPLLTSKVKLLLLLFASKNVWTEDVFKLNTFNFHR